jgi:hypothetical protein
VRILDREVDMSVPIVVGGYRDRRVIAIPAVCKVPTSTETIDERTGDDVLRVDAGNEVVPSNVDVPYAVRSL